MPQDTTVILAAAGTNSRFGQRFSRKFLRPWQNQPWDHPTVGA
jgi:CTP:molybdopterin cytidylyltransferase MocA